jgi:hypothetical protein
MKNSKIFILSLLASCSILAQESQAQSKAPYYSNRLNLFEGYERLKPDDVYGAIIAWASPNFIKDKDHLIVNAEFRVGYNFLCSDQNTLVSLFVGAGYLDNFRKAHEHNRHYLRKIQEHSLRLAYGSYGVLVDHQFTPLFSMGLNVKGILGKGEIGSRYHNNAFTAGGDFGLPITFRFAPTRAWDLRFEPFYMVLNSKQDTTNYLGLRLFIGYRF